MRQLLVALGVFAFAGSASAQYPTGSVSPPVGVNKHPVAGGYYHSNAAFGEAYRNNAAGSVYSDHAFLFGSSRSFFAPCGPFVGEKCKAPSLFGRKQPCPPAPPCDTCGK